MYLIFSPRSPWHHVQRTQNGVRMRLSVKAVVKKIVICFALLYCFSCLRVLLPQPIQPMGVVHLARLAVQWQRFPVEKADDTFRKNITVPVSVNVDTLAKHLNQTWKSNIYSAKDNIDKQFLPVMTAEQRLKMYVTFETFLQACEWANLTYFLIGGSLLGMYRHHGFIPWDDDIDVAMSASDWRQIRYVLSHIPGYELYAPSDVQWKFYMKNLQPIKNKPFRWPNVDIFFYTEDSTYIWGLTTGLKGELFVKKSDLFPLQYRPFENRNAAAPCNTRDILINRFDVDLCVSLSYGHKTGASLADVKKRPCKELHGAYPFVFRSPGIDGGMMETLKIGDHVVKNVTLPVSCSSTFLSG
ncbi:uncharacterized protein LOC124136903 [Haliotis rufescens]|uniref:uncharacterized protein LOC124136903 n=1 Tax=Haliotis rufescens TaxID=6454 RepID=UPI001EAF9A8F|nr:uncharacterized protein LOC124136903 [Haliotis rufescens]XP_048258300.1 uncharacterized protein LOC124136903 [Haliotis rufescens]XP_048258305.1 uncharacterized protein LOC124136903 [Haliotis rufescens]XP_048258307.1 uncharacterized protein LOC124136903 [Haliotis rufescens]XP_048258313.1 uncharacterized protein LOC124136903 [Haliotis rufescens]XP_048258318.1 uncharacterized protein LOC124136903 [Haliotis rufescens]XP_048258326.1 uncharacterized protein LOC124136903 [Haliotis rufescens]